MRGSARRDGDDFEPLLAGAPPQIAAAAKAAQDLAVGRGSVNDFISELASLRTLVETQSVEIDQMRRSLSQPNSPARLPPPEREAPAVSAAPSLSSAAAVAAAKIQLLDEARTHEHITAHAATLGADQRPDLKKHLAAHRNKLTARRPRIGILGSTRGTNTLHIYQEIAAGRFDAEVAVVISNISKAVILERARAAGVPAVHVLGKGRTREEFDALCTRHAALAARLALLESMGQVNTESPAKTTAKSKPISKRKATPKKNGK